jgi:cell division septal protein FtsQ
MVARNPQVEQRFSQASARRRHNLTFAVEGAELRLPSLPMVQVGWRVLSGTIVATLLVALYAVFSSSAFVIGRVELRGATRLSAQNVNAVLRLAGASIFGVEMDPIRATLEEQFPEMESFSVHVGFPARVVVEVQERLPVVAWEQSDITVWLDEAGVAFIPEGEVTGLIQVRALEPPPPLDGESYARHQLIRPTMVAAIQALSAHAPEGQAMVYDPQLGFGWTDPQGWQVFFGQDGTEIEQRLAVYQALVEQLNSRNLAPTMISVAHLHAPYYRVDY